MKDDTSIFNEQIREALAAASPMAALRKVIADDLAKGTPPDAVKEKLEATRGRFPEKEDLLLELLDYLVGWCSPHMRLD